MNLVGLLGVATGGGRRAGHLGTRGFQNQVLKLRDKRVTMGNE
jgi:hypothetical protein